MRRSTRFTILLGLCGAFALAVVVVFWTADHGPWREVEPAADMPAAAPPIVSAPSSSPTPPPEMHPPGAGPVALDGRAPSPPE
ncbi:MAG TPA: hypothetical protein VLC06_21385 [Polyangia bacterium]|nr:hypothetical protein [Polyangia bacterium]